MKETAITYLDATPLISLIELCATNSRLTTINTSGLERLEKLNINSTEIVELNASFMVSLI